MRCVPSAAMAPPERCRRTGDFGGASLSMDDVMKSAAKRKLSIPTLEERVEALMEELDQAIDQLCEERRPKGENGAVPRGSVRLIIESKGFVTTTQIETRAMTSRTVTFRVSSAAKTRLGWAPTILILGPILPLAARAITSQAMRAKWARRSITSAISTPMAAAHCRRIGTHAPVSP